MLIELNLPSLVSRLCKGQMALALGLEESHLNDRLVSLGVSALSGQNSSTA